MSEQVLDIIKRRYKSMESIKPKNDGKDIKKGIKTFVICLIFLVLLLSSAYTVKAGHRGVLLTFGKPSMDAVGEGLHFKIPFAQTIKRFEVKTQKIEVGADASSSDLQNVQTVIALNYHLQPDMVPKLYQEIGTSFQSRIIDPAIQESVKAVQAKFTAEELITRRSEVRVQIQEFLSEKLDVYYIEVDSFNIINFKFSDEFNDAIEQKVTAEQLMLKAEMDLERIRVEKEQIITQAEAEAESLRLQKAQITPDLIELRKIEVQRLAIEKWNGILPQVTGGAIPFIDIRDETQEPITV